MSKKILAVDDSASIRQIVTFVLKGAGYEVIEAVDGQDGLEKANRHKVNLVITDINMPRMDGLELLASKKPSPFHTFLTAKSVQKI